MKLAVGDVVVYGAHGAGSISARETRMVLGEQQVVIALALSGGLSVELPLARAEGLLRPVADEEELMRVKEVLSADAVPSSESWAKRQQEAQAKLSSTLGLAEILRDGASREEAGGRRSPLSPTESELIRKARELLTTEIALSRGIEREEASDWIDAQLSAATA
jgi:CarD family transcriptional regulator